MTRDMTELGSKLGNAIGQIIVTRNRLSAALEDDHHMLTEVDIDFMVSLLEVAEKNLVDTALGIAEALDAGKVNNGT